MKRKRKRKVTDFDYQSNICTGREETDRKPLKNAELSLSSLCLAYSE